MFYDNFSIGPNLSQPIQPLPSAGWEMSTGQRAVKFCGCREVWYDMIRYDIFACAQKLT